MIGTKGKREIIVKSIAFYWYITTDEDGVAKIRIISGDKKWRFVCGFDKDIAIGSQYIKELILSVYFRGVEADYRQGQATHVGVCLQHQEGHTREAGDGDAETMSACLRVDS